MWAMGIRNSYTLEVGQSLKRHELRRNFFRLHSVDRR